MRMQCMHAGLIHREEHCVDHECAAERRPKAPEEDTHSLIPVAL